MTMTKPASGRHARISLPAPARRSPAGRHNLLNTALVGRSHRSSVGKARLKLAIDLTREVLEVPARLSHRHRAGLRHRRRRNGDVVAAGRSAASTCWPGKASAKAG